MAGVGSYLKKHTEALVKDVGIEPACELTGKSKATLGRYYSEMDEHSDRFMPIDAVAALERPAPGKLRQQKPPFPVRRTLRRLS